MLAMPSLFRVATTAARIILKPQVLFAFAVALASSAQAQTRNPYFELQCSMAGAYCDRVYETTPPRKETFDELLQRKDRERAQREQQRRDQDAREQWQREQARLTREEQAREARLAQEQERENRRQMKASRVVIAPAFVRWFHTGWPVPQWLLAGLIVAFATMVHIGRNASSSPSGLFYALTGIALLCIPFTYEPAENPNPSFGLLIQLSPFFALLALNGLHFLRGWHYLFVSHPATIVAGPPLREGALFPKQELAQSLRPHPAQLLDHPPAYKSRDLTEKAHALRAKIDADAEIAAAAMRRDRARAAKMQADAELREARKKLPWWQRWMWW